MGLQPDFELIEGLRRAEGVPVMVGANSVVKRDASGRVTLHRLAESRFDEEQLVVPLSAAAGNFHFSGVQIDWEVVPMPKRFAKSIRFGAGSEAFDAEKIGASIVLRHWRPGDRYQPIGMPKAVKLQDLFVNQKIPRADRQKLLVAATAAGEIVWVERLRISEWFKLDNSTKKQLKWTWHRRSAPLVASGHSEW